MSLKENYYLSLEITSTVWLKKTDDLFDFESDNISSKTFSFNEDDKENYIISYKENNEEYNDILPSRKLKEKLQNNDTTKIISVLIYNNLSFNFSIINSYKRKKSENIFKPDNCERMWSVISNDEYSLVKEGDIIKLGRLRLKFDKIVFNKTQIENYLCSKPNNTINAMLTTSINPRELDDFNLTQNFNNNYKDNISENLSLMVSRNNFFLDDNINTKRGENQEKIICRLCYQDDSNISDPLISPCKCNGSMKYIHYSCLKRSIKQKIQVRREENCDLYFFKTYCCEICLDIYPKYITYKSNIYNLVDIDTSKYQEYILASIIYYTEINNSDKKQLSYLGYLIFKIDDQSELKIGRNQNNHIVLKDISISRNHCVLKRENNNLKIKDAKSKFGTLLYLKNIKKIEVDKPMNLVSGKHKFIFDLKYQKRTFSLFSNWFNQSCCSCNQNSKDKGEFIMKYKSKKEEKDKIKELKSNDSLYDFELDDKYDYYKRFKDNDSYNDYIINMDYIIGVKDPFAGLDKYYTKK
jgi:hypothetical protein